MKIIQNYSSKLALLLVATIFVAVGCKRDLEDLSPADSPVNPDVYIDGFSGGLNYAAFGGSDVTAFEVDTDISYEGTSSMRFAVPDANDPAGAYAGGAFFTGSGRDLTGFDALTFWARGSKAATIDVIGFGNDLGESKYVTTLNDVAINTNWKKYYIPIPDPSKLVSEKGMLYYAEGPEEGLGYTFWLDEVKFEKLGTLAHEKPGILETQDQTIGTETGANLPIGGTFVTVNLPTGVDQRVDAAPAYFDYTSSNTDIASVSDAGVVSILDAGSATITATLAGVEAAGSLTIESSGEAIVPLSPAPTPTQDPADVISMFSNAYTDVPVDLWNTFWEFSTAQTTDLQIQGDDVKRYTSLNFVGIEFTSSKINATSMTHFHMDIWTPDATAAPAAFNVLLVDFGADGNFDGGDDSSHEITRTAPTLMTGEWVSLDMPLSEFTGLTNRANLAQLVLSGDLPNVFVDNVYFYDDGNGGGGGGGGDTEPTVGAPNPTANAADVISLFSDSYTNLDGTNLNPDWGQETAVSEVSVGGNNTLLYSGLNYQGMELAGATDVSAMTHLHIDYWTANSAALNVFLISDGPVETASAMPVPTSGWGSVDIPLGNFSPVDLAGIIQLKFDGSGDIYLDNIYFYEDDGGGGGGGGDTPTVAAPTPTLPAGDVISIFSDAYTNVDSNLNPDWGQATATSEVSIAGDNTLLYAGLNYQGLELAASVDASGMTMIHIDYWTANSTAFNFFLISPGPIETPYAMPVPTSGWQSIDIPLSDFSPVDLADIFQFKSDGNGDIYIDNIYFHNN